MITATTPRVSYVAGGGPGDDDFTYSFMIFQTTDLLVYVDSVLKTLNTHYTVLMSVGGIGGTVTFGPAYIPVALSVVEIVRSIPLTQSMDLVEGDRLPAETLEATFDKMMMILQDINSKVSSLFIVDRLTTTQKNALTATNGMVVYDITLNKFQGYQDGSWQNLI